MSASAPWLVGGEFKLLMEKEIVEPPGKRALTTFDKVTTTLAVSPMHCTAELTFYLN